MNKTTSEQVIKEAQKIVKDGVKILSAHKDWFVGAISGQFWVLVFEMDGNKQRCIVSEAELGIIRTMP